MPMAAMAAPAAAAELIWSRPPGLAALALPVLLVLLARVRREPARVATGTLAVWREVEAVAPAHADRSRPRVPPATWLFVLALALGALGLAGPRLVAPEGPRTWTIVVDDAPSTALPLADGSGETRLERALDDLHAWLRAHSAPTDRVRWIRADGDERVLGGHAAPDRAWATQRRVGGPRDFAARVVALDRAGTIAVSDRAPAAELDHAGWFASGGPDVPGPIAASADALIVWNGTGLVERPAADLGGRLVLDASAGELPALVVELAEVWAGARGVSVVRGEGAGRLVIRARASDGRACLAGRDGWRVRASGGLAEGASGARAWLGGGAQQVVIAWAPGRIDVSAGAADVIDGEPAQVAVSFAELFDAALLPHPEAIALRDRGSAGVAGVREPATPQREAGGGVGWTKAPLDAWLAGVGALVALLGLAVGRDGGGRLA